MPRYTPTTTSLLGGVALEVPDAASFLSMREEIHRRQLYRFQASRPDPFIVDVGANIGLSVAYFKWLYPRADVVAYEADPTIFRYLERNVKALGLEGVLCHNCAAWVSAGTIPFFSEGGDAGRQFPSDGVPQLLVPTIRLKETIDRPVDMLKMDVEGAEAAILEDCRDRLHWIDRMFVEYHSFRGREQRIKDVLEILQDAGFRLWMDAAVKVQTPFVGHHSYRDMDLQLNIFAWRE
jgi:FkbM family methyltransferase